MQTRILLDHEKTPDGTGHVVRALLRIDGTAPDPKNRIPLNLCVVLDRSGSMGGAKLEHAKQAAALLVRRLWPEDVVSIVSYDDQVLTVAEPASGAEQHGVPERLAAILPGGSTNLSGGWLRGRELVASGRRDGGVDRVLLLTDGLANVGITDPDQLVGLCRGALERGVTTTTLGFGEDYDETLLRRMAEAGGGSTYYIEDPDGAPAVFAEEIEGLLSLCAHDIRVEVRPAAAAQVTLVHHAYPSHEIEGGVRLELGDLYARDPRRLLAEFAVPVADPGEEVAIAELVVTAQVVRESGAVEREEIRLPIRASLAEGPRVEPEVRRELLLQEAARVRQEVREARESGDFDRADGMLCEVSERLASFDPADPELAEEAEDLRDMAERFRAHRVTEADAKYLYERAYAGATCRPGNARAISRVERRRERRPRPGL